MLTQLLLPGMVLISNMQTMYRSPQSTYTYNYVSTSVSSAGRILHSEPSPDHINRVCNDGSHKPS